MTATGTLPTLVFVHGALVRDGSWWWRPTADLLLERTGVASVAVALPSCGETDADGGDLQDDAAALRAVLDAHDDVVLVGHSYGGTVIAEAGAHPSVRHVVLVSSYTPPIGASQGSVMSGEPDPVAVRVDDGRVVLDGYDAAFFGAPLPAGRRRAPAARRVRPDDVAGRGGLRRDDDPDRVGRRRVHRRGVHGGPQHHGGAAAVARRPGDRHRGAPDRAPPVHQPAGPRRRPARAAARLIRLRRTGRRTPPAPPAAMPSPRGSTRRRGPRPHLPRPRRATHGRRPPGRPSSPRTRP